MTNGEMIQKVFNCEVCEPIIEDDIIHVIFADKKDSAIGFDWSWWNAEYKEPTTNNDLGVDCISRAYLLDDSKYHTVFNDDTGNFEDVVYREDIEKAPSVTPQPRKGHWIFDGDCLICSKCKKAYSFSGSNFCPNCGVDMREVEGGRKME